VNKARKFGNVAQLLARNPLGVIALFIVLIYGFATLLLGVSSLSLDRYQRDPLVYFLVSFPVLVLAAFYRLVTAHHEKLYAPTDFKDETLFLRTLSPRQQRERLEAGIKEVGTAERLPGGMTPSNEIEQRRIQVTPSEYALAEELAFRQLEMEFNLPVRRHVSTSNRAELALDGVIATDEGIVLIEVKLLRANLSRTVLDAIVARTREAGNQFWRPTHLLLVVIADMADRDVGTLKTEISKELRASDPSAELRVYRLAELKELLGASPSIRQPSAVG